MSTYGGVFNLLSIKMAELLTQEQFWKKMVDKRDNLLEQRSEKIDKEISNILKWIDFENLCIEQQEQLIDKARSKAESQSYQEDLKLTILRNIWNTSYENHYWETPSPLVNKLMYDFFCW